MQHKKSMILFFWVAIFALILTACTSPSSETSTPTPVRLRLSVALTPQEIASFQPAINELTAAHPEWIIEIETVPQAGFTEKINAQLAGNDLPDVIRVQGLSVQQWIRQDAFLDLSAFTQLSDLQDDFYTGPLDQFVWQDTLWGIPDTAAPEVVFYNRDMFDQAGLAYPTDDWTYEDMRQAAVLLTLDAEGRNPSDPDFDPQAIQQWGWNGGLTYFWQRHLVRAFGGDFCVNNDCTLMNFTTPETVRAVEWWSALVNQDHAALYDPYGGSQTGVPGDPFIAGKAAMGYNGFFAVGQLNEAGNINYDVVQPFQGTEGDRYTPLSVFGYVIAANTEHPEAAWALVEALTSSEFLSETWGKPGHAVPARRSAAEAVINPSHPPENQAAIVAAMEYGEVFKPYTASAFEVYGLTADWFVKAMRGDVPVAEAMAEIEKLANETLAGDR